MLAGVACLFVSFAWVKGEPALFCEKTDCDLPNCYCDAKKIPGNLSPNETPQMVLFAFNDPITGPTRKKIAEIFPDKMLNPITGCAIGITVFVIGTGSDYCATHRLFVRGHEIAIGGANRTGNIDNWTSHDWAKQMSDHATEMMEKAFLPDDHIRGARAPLQKPGGAPMYDMLYEKGFSYDSSLLTGTGFLDVRSPPQWPTTLDTEWTKCYTPKCPINSYPGLWEIGIERLANPESGRPCAYLDACLVTMKTEAEVYKLLYQNFRFHYDSNRAPFIINIQTKTLRSRIAKGGIKRFIKKILSDEHDDTFVLTMQDAIDWMQAPVPISEIASSDMWKCPDRSFHRCTIKNEDGTGRDQDGFSSPFKSMEFVKVLWLYQFFFLILAYFVVLKYDKQS